MIDHWTTDEHLKTVYKESNFLSANSGAIGRSEFKFIKTESKKKNTNVALLHIYNKTNALFETLLVNDFNVSSFQTIPDWADQWRTSKKADKSGELTTAAE